MASGKTTTLIARIVWLIAQGVDPSVIAAITFNRRAAEELEVRLRPALEPLGTAAAIRVRTFHALGREILASVGETVEPLVDRTEVLRRVVPDAGPVGWRRLDDAFSRLKLDLQVTADDIRADPEPGPVGRIFVACEDALAACGGLDFDDLVARALRRLRSDPIALQRWHATCAHLLVDEVQDVDRSQLELALLLAAPENRVFLVGDDDQSIYGWRLADVKRRVCHMGNPAPGAPVSPKSLLAGIAAGSQARTTRHFQVRVPAPSGRRPRPSGLLVEPRPLGAVVVKLRVPVLVDVRKRTLPHL